MKRYFFTTTRPGTHVPAGATDPFHCKSGWEYVNCPNGAGYIVVMLEEHCDPDPSWTELPHLLEQKPLPPNVVAAIGNLVPLAPGDQTYHLALKLSATQSGRFHP